MARLRTRVALFSAATLATTAAVATFTVGSSTASSAPAVPTVAMTPAASDTTGAKKGLTVKGAVHEPGPISRADLEGMKAHTFTMTYQTSSGPQTHKYSGPLLIDVLDVADPAFSSDKHDPLRYAILIKASDGFLAAVSWGEIEPELENKHVIVALTEDGKKLDRPRLVIPRDMHGARQVYDVTALILLRLSPALAKGEAGAMSEDDSTAHNH
jgi:hypothetical protein